MLGTGTVRTSAVVMVRFGPPALGALGGAIRAAQADDPLAPVTVVIPSGHAAVAVRRHLARLPHPDGRRGLVNVQWVSMPQLAELLAAPLLVDEGRPPLTHPIRRAAIRAALDDAPGRFAPVIDNPSTERSIELTFAELRDLDEPELDRLAKLGGRPHDLVRLFRSYRERCAPYADERHAFDRAVAAVEGGAASLAAIGSVVLYLPTRLSRPERRLVRALAESVRVTALLGITADASVDESARELGVQLADGLATRPIDVGHDPVADAVTSSAAPRFVRAPDADEEVRVAVRRILAAVAEGVLPDDIAVVSRVGEPYSLLVHEHLTVAGIPHYAPSSLSLGQTVAGRALLGFLRVSEGGFRRAELFRWLRSAPVRFVDGDRVPQFDRLARRAGVAGGVEQWHQRLDRLEADYGRAVPPRADDVADVRALRAFIDGLAELATPPEQLTWAGFAEWAVAILGRLVDPRPASANTDAPAGTATRWPDHEIEAFDHVGEVLASLAALDAVQPRVDEARFRRVLDEELARPTQSVGSFGHGVFVGRLTDIAGARHELVIVLGMAEGSFPPRGQEDPLLPDHERRRLGGALPDRRPARGDEARSFLAALAAAPAHQLSFARVDTRSQREATPSRFFLRELSRVRGEHTGFDDLDGVSSPVFLDVSSFQSGAMAADPAVSEHEFAVAALLGGQAPDAGLRSGLDAARARMLGEFSIWTGHAGPEHAPRFTDEKVGSSTSFEQWATCPFRYFLSHVLGVRALDTYADADAISGLDRGSLVHDVLESFIAESLHRRPEHPWTADDHERLRELAREVASRYEQEGRTGRPLLWQLELDALLRRLETILDVDAHHRAEAGVEPVAVELVFGAGSGPGAGSDDAGIPAVEFTLPSGRTVAFRGAIDRIDLDPSSGHLVVLDYKTGKADKYRGIDVDITCKGRHLQLVIYGEAARRQFGGDAVDAYYWFVEQKQSTLRMGTTIDDTHRRRFLHVLEVIVDGIEEGKFPANPGAPDFWGFEHCGFCDYNRVCPTTRDDDWEGVRMSGSLADYVALAEPERRAVAEAEPDPEAAAELDASGPTAEIAVTST